MEICWEQPQGTQLEVYLSLVSGMCSCKLHWAVWEQGTVVVFCEHGHSITRGYFSTCFRKIALWMARPHVQCWRFYSRCDMPVKSWRQRPAGYKWSFKNTSSFLTQEHWLKKGAQTAVKTNHIHYLTAASYFKCILFQRHEYTFSYVLLSNAGKTQNSSRRLLALGKSKHQSF